MDEEGVGKRKGVGGYSSSLTTDLAVKENPSKTAVSSEFKLEAGP